MRMAKGKTCALILGVRVDSKKADGMKFIINLDMPDVKEHYLAEIGNATLTNIKGGQAAEPDLTITLNRADLETMMSGRATMEGLAAAGKVTLVGNTKILDDLKSVTVQFNPNFQLLPRTAAGLTPYETARDRLFEEEDVELTAE